jgi:hypothetical protein
MSTLPHVSPLAHAVISRLCNVIPDADALPPSTKHGAVSVEITLDHAAGTEAYVVNLDDVTVSAMPKAGAPTAAALTVAGVARMLRAARHAGALAPHVESAMVAALFDTSEPDPADVARIETIRAAASAHLPPRASSPRVSLVAARTLPTWHRVG